MAYHEPDWNLYRSFVAVLDHGSLSAAARELGLTQPTVGRHIDTLQYRLGLPLFVRGPEGLSPTEAALELRPHAEALKSAAATLQRAASSIGQGVRGTVRISASEVVGIEILPAIFREIRHYYPDLEIEMVPTNRLSDLLRRDADIAVRMVAPKQEALIASPIGGITVGLFAHRSYLEGRQIPRRFAELAGHDLIGFDESVADSQTVLRHAPQLAEFKPVVRTDSHLAQLAMIRAGLGIGICQIGLAGRSADLVRVLPEFGVDLETWITMHEDLRDNLRCRVVFDALVEGMMHYWQSQPHPLPPVSVR